MYGARVLTSPVGGARTQSADLGSWGSHEEESTDMKRTMSKYVYLFSPVLISLSLAACSSDDGNYPPTTGGSSTSSGNPPPPAATSSAPPAPSASSASGSSSSGTSSPAAAKTVDLSGASFSPSTVTIKAGETVRWVWKSGSHNVVSGKSCSPDGKFSSGNLQAPPTTFEHTFDAPGTFDYYCDPHCGMGMVGKVVVQ